MNPNTNELGAEFDLIESTDDGWLQLPLAAIREVGPAAQTLGGLLSITDKETFVRQPTIAEKSWLPLRTAKRHLKELDEFGWIVNQGRKRGKWRWARRTCTFTITEKSHQACAKVPGVKFRYGVLPWWACCSIRGFGKLSWSTKCVLSILLADLKMLVKLIEQREGVELDREDLWGAIDDYRGEERFKFSLSDLQLLTGLNHESLIDAKVALDRLGIVHWKAGQRKGGRIGGHILMPRSSFRVAGAPDGEVVIHTATTATVSTREARVEHACLTQPCLAERGTRPYSKTGT